MRLICVRIDQKHSRKFYSLSAFNHRFNFGFDSLEELDVYLDNTNVSNFFAEVFIFNPAE